MTDRYLFDYTQVPVHNEWREGERLKERPFIRVGTPSVGIVAIGNEGIVSHLTIDNAEMLSKALIKSIAAATPPPSKADRIRVWTHRLRAASYATNTADQIDKILDEDGEL